MPASYRIDRVKRRVTTVGAGTVSWDDIISHMESLAKDPDFQPTFTQLLDFTGVTRVDLNHDQIFELAKRTVFSKGSKRAFVTANAYQYGMSRMFQSYRKMFGTEAIHVFRGLEEAERWLEHKDEPGERAPVPARRA
jgi:hypothetical protein